MGDALHGVTSFDLASKAGALVLAYTTSRGAPRRPRSESEVVLGVVRDSGVVSRQEFTLFQGAHSRPISPRIISHDESLTIVYTLSYKARRSDAAEVVVDERGAMQSRIFFMRSGDIGVTWTPPREVGPIGAPEPIVGSRSSSWLVTEVEPVFLEDNLLIFYTAGALYMTRAQGPTRWTSPARVAGPPPDPSSPGYAALSPSADAGDDGGLLTWIDTRFHKSDRSATNPLGGFPWGDRPDWANNDVFSLPLGTIAHGSRDRVSAALPARHTPDLSYASTVRARVLTDSAYVIWAGRVKVGRATRDAGEPPKLFYSVVPLH